MILTGVFMMNRVRTIFFPRNPYLFSDMTWGMMYVLHGLAGVGLIALVMVHVYFAVRPEKLPITKSMIFGWMSRDFYLEEHDPERWPVEASAPPRDPGEQRPGGITDARLILRSAATRSKNVTSSCWPMRRKGFPVTKAAGQADKFANSCVRAAKR